MATQYLFGGRGGGVSHRILRSKFGRVTRYRSTMMCGGVADGFGRVAVLLTEDLLS